MERKVGERVALKEYCMLLSEKMKIDGGKEENVKFKESNKERIKGFIGIIMKNIND
jgi:hypothetical protein